MRVLWASLGMLACWPPGCAEFGGHSISSHRVEQATSDGLLGAGDVRALAERGLALDDTWNRAALHELMITVESQVGQGSTFWFTVRLPKGDERAIRPRGRVIMRVRIEPKRMPTTRDIEAATSVRSRSEKRTA